MDSLKINVKKNYFILIKILSRYSGSLNNSWLQYTLFIRTLRFELHCWFLFLDGFEHQNVLFSLNQACVFLIIYSFACSYYILRYPTIIEIISMNCGQYIHYKKKTPQKAQSSEKPHRRPHRRTNQPPPQNTTNQNPPRKPQKPHNLKLTPAYGG